MKMFFQLTGLNGAKEKIRLTQRERLNQAAGFIKATAGCVEFLKELLAEAESAEKHRAGSVLLPKK